MIRPECEDTRQVINGVADWLDNLERPPQPEDKDYDDALANLGLILSRAEEAFVSRPEGCRMTSNGSSFICMTCGLHVNL